MCFGKTDNFLVAVAYGTTRLYIRQLACELLKLPLPTHWHVYIYNIDVALMMFCLISLHYKFSILMKLLFCACSVWSQHRFSTRELIFPVEKLQQRSSDSDDGWRNQSRSWMLLVSLHLLKQVARIRELTYTATLTFGPLIMWRQLYVSGFFQSKGVFMVRSWCPFAMVIHCTLLDFFISVYNYLFISFLLPLVSQLKVDTAFFLLYYKPLWYSVL